MLVSYPLDPAAAVAYARRWAFSRNPAYSDFDGMGGDCTNFISQCLYAAGAVMNYEKDVGWYYRSLRDRAAAWTGVEYFYRFLVRNLSVGPYGKEVPAAQARVGDVIQLGDDAGFYHSLLVVSVRDGTPRVAAHTFNAFDRPLDTYHFARLRVLRVEGARKKITGSV